MPSRRKTEASEEEDNADFDFMTSQPSASSEDQLLERVLAERIAAAKEKKKQEREKRFLEGATNTLNKPLSGAEEDIKMACESIEQLYEQFVLEYAAAEDRIYKVWTEVLQQHHTLESLIKAKHKAAIELASASEEKHIHGLSKIKGACEQFEEAVQYLLHDSKSDDEEDEDDED